MSHMLYVGNLPLSATEGALTAKFNRFGTVVTARLNADPATARNRRCAFVEMLNATEMQRAIDGLNLAEYDGRLLTVHRAAGTAEVKS